MPLVIRQNTVGRIADRQMVDAALMREVGTLLARRIRTRTESGKDVDGGSFAPLSADYAKARQKAGVGTRSNLTLSGAMLNDMQVTRVDRRMATISFTSQDNTPGHGGTLIQRSRETGANLKARMANGDGRVRREFFGLSDQDIEVATEAVARALDRFVS